MTFVHNLIYNQTHKIKSIKYIFIQCNFIYITYYIITFLNKAFINCTIYSKKVTNTIFFIKIK